MIDKFKPYDTTRISAFLAAISAATERVNNLSARLTTLAAVSGTAALQIAGLSNAAHTVATGQALATGCQCKCEAPTTPPPTASSLWEKAWKGFFLATAAIGAAGIWLAAMKRLWAILTSPIVINGLAAIGRIVMSLRLVEFAFEAVAAVAETLGELFVAAAALVTGLSIPTIAIGAVLLAGASYLVWRNWSAIVRAIRRLGTAVAHEATSIMHKLMTAVEGGEPEGSSTEDVGSAGDAGISQRKRSRPYNIAPSVFDSVAASFSSVPFRAFAALNKPQLWHGFQQEPLTVRKAVAIALLGVPLLAPPAMAAFPSRQGGAEAACAPSITINSSPTIVINSSQTADFEQQIMEALRRHREALYEQWCRELQRRQRTEF
jgi:hypothetical protein